MSVLDLFRLGGKTALVTGAAKGLGRSLALALAEAGADIAGLDKLPCEETAGLVEKTGRRFLEIRCDLRGTFAADYDEVVRQVITAWGRLDILVNNAGVTFPNAVVDIREQDYDEETLVNQKALFFLSQAVGRHMAQAGGGKIINIASLNAFVGGVRAASYTATKGAVAAITRAMASEWAELGVNVNCIAPGWILTDNTKNIWQDAILYPQICANIPAGRWGKPEDFMGTVVFLASRASDYLHGSIIIVDGGLFLR